MAGKRKVVRYRRPPNINIGMLIFAVIFVYMVFSVYTYIRRDKIQPYEVTEGSIVNDRQYTGLILREETTEYAESSGYINYYIQEGKRAAAGTGIYSIDETGRLAEVLAESGTERTLTEENLKELKSRLTSYSLSMSEDDFSRVYDEKYSLEAMVLEYVNFNALSSQGELEEALGTGFRQVRTPVSGVVSYAVDSFEDLEASQVTAEMFDRTNYSRGITRAGDLVEAGTPVYKIITSDNWSLLFPLSEEDAAEYASETSLQVRLAGHDRVISGDYSTVTGADGLQYGKLDFTKYMIQYESERYLDFEVMTSVEEGLKIPVSSVTSKNFYLVPVDFLEQGGDSDDSGFLKEVYTESGTSVEFTPVNIYYSTEEYYYIDTAEDEPIHAGDYLVKPGSSSERYQVGATASLQGVYNINRGYAVFKQIEILEENGEFYTIKENTSYGLNVYDHIVLDASAVDAEGALIYQ